MSLFWVLKLLHLKHEKGHIRYIDTIYILD